MKESGNACVCRVQGTGDGSGHIAISYITLIFYWSNNGINGGTNNNNNNSAQIVFHRNRYFFFAILHASWIFAIVVVLVCFCLLAEWIVFVFVFVFLFSFQCFNSSKWVLRLRVRKRFTVVNGWNKSDDARAMMIMMTDDDSMQCHIHWPLNNIVLKCDQSIERSIRRSIKNERCIH